MGVVPEDWGTPETVWLDKMGMGESKKPSLSLFLGHVFEPHIVSDYSTTDAVQNSGLVIRRSPGFMVSEDEQFGCTPDAWFENSLGTVAYGFEAKSTTVKDGWGPSWSQEIPARVFVQVQHSMMVANTDRWAVGMNLYKREDKEEIACLVMEHGDLRPEDLARFVVDRRFYIIQRHEETIRNIQEVGRKFWKDYIVPRVRPTEGGNPVLYIPTPTKQVVPAPDLLEVIHEVATIKKSIKAQTDRMEKLNKQIRSAIEDLDAKAVIAGGYTASVTVVPRTGGFDYERAFDAACNIGSISESAAQEILSNMKKPDSVTYRLDIKEDK
jgi:hypothetical protein